VLVPDKEWLYSHLRAKAVDTHVLPSQGRADVGLLLSLVREIRAFRPHLIHAHFLDSGVYGTLASTFAGKVPLICTFHGPPDVNPDDPLLGLKARILNRPRNRLVYVSHALRRHLEPVLGADKTLGVVIHNGITIAEATVADLAEIDREDGDLLVGAVGNIRVAKDYPNLLHAARLVCDRRSDVHFAVVGEGAGTLLRDLHGLRDSLGLRGRVHFLGFRSDASSLMAAFDVYVSSSSDEGLPLASLEAMGMGKPVVLTDCGGVPEVVEDGRTGLLVSVRDPEALAAGILHLLDHPEFAAKLGSEARKTVQARFTLQGMLDAYGDLYQSLVPSRSGTDP
jgi:glycosyltransferase involved in cell wall biosynthesis